MAQSTPANKEFDIVVFGATGFTGGYVVREMQETCGTVRSWAIAGRTRSKLNSLHEELGLSEGVGVIQATVDEEESIREMCKRADLVINCVGPYAVYRGDMVIRVCIEEGSSYVDLTGEIGYLEQVRDKYNQLAEENGVFVVPACGYVSMVSEIAINCALETMTSSQLSCVDSYQIMTNTGGAHTGTWHSILDMMSKWKKTYRVVTRMERVQAPSLRQGIKWPIFYKSSLKRWFMRFPANSHFIRLSQSDRGKRTGRGEPALAITESMSPDGLFNIIFMLLALMPIFVLAQISCVRNFLVKSYRGGPTHEMIKKSSFRCIVDTSLSGADGERKNVRVNVSGSNPGYPATSCLCVNGALTLLDEKSNIQSNTERKGGVLTPGFVFENTTLVERLNKSNKVLFQTDERDS